MVKGMRRAEQIVEFAPRDAMALKASKLQDRVRRSMLSSASRRRLNLRRRPSLQAMPSG